MNTQLLQVASMVAFSLAGLLAVVAIVLFFWLDVKNIWDDLSGKSAARQIKELRERNKRPVDRKNIRNVYRYEKQEETTVLSQNKNSAAVLGNGSVIVLNVMVIHTEEGIT